MLKKAVCMLAACVVGLGLFCGCGDETPTGTFYTLQEAYDNGYLTQEDLMSIAYYYNGGREGNEDIMTEDFTPLPKTPKDLSEEIEYKIKLTYRYEQNIPSNQCASIYIWNYYGTYYDCVIVGISDKFYAYDPLVIPEYAVDDVVFYNIATSDIRVWRKI